MERHDVSVRSRAGNHQRHATQQPDAPLGDDDRTGLRVLYPDAADPLHQGSVSGRIIPANPPRPSGLSAPDVTGVFGAHVVAVDNTTGAVIGATIGGMELRCAGAGAV